MAHGEDRFHERRQVNIDRHLFEEHVVELRELPQGQFPQAVRVALAAVHPKHTPSTEERIMAEYILDGFRPVVVEG